MKLHLIKIAAGGKRSGFGNATKLGLCMQGLTVAAEALRSNFCARALGAVTRWMLPLGPGMHLGHAKQMSHMVLGPRSAAPPRRAVPCVLSLGLQLP